MGGSVDVDVVLGRGFSREERNPFVNPLNRNSVFNLFQSRVEEWSGGELLAGR